MIFASASKFLVLLDSLGTVKLCKSWLTALVLTGMARPMATSRAPAPSMARRAARAVARWSLIVLLLFKLIGNWSQHLSGPSLYPIPVYPHLLSKVCKSNLTFRFMSRERGDIRELFILTRSILLKHAPHCSQLSLLLAGRKMQSRQNCWLSCAFAKQKQKKM